MKRIFILVLIIMAGLSCQTEEPRLDPVQLKQEVRDTERAFAEKAKSDGILPAFLEYAADDAVISRNNVIYQGKQEIEKYFTDNELPYEDISLEWSPSFIDVSVSGDLAYTYGEYRFSFTDSTGVKFTDTGIFHTVWKRQADGSWRYVWD